MTELVDPIDGKKIIKGSKGTTSTLRCKKGESAEDCAERHTAAGWKVPPGAKLGADNVGPLLEW